MIRYQESSGPERLSVVTITATLEDMRKHGLRGGLPQEEAFFLLRQIGLLEAQLAEARKLLAEHINGHSEYRCNVRDFLSRTDRS